MPQIRLVLADTDQLFLEKFSAYLKSCKTTHFALEPNKKRVKNE